jgi:hypothetical protein
VALTAQWAAFICWVDDCIDGSVPPLSSAGVERFTAPLRQVLDSGQEMPDVTAPYAAVLAGLWDRTSAGMPARWRRRFVTGYTDFLDATEQEVALRRAGVRLSLPEYVRLRRRTITLLPMLDVLERTGHVALAETPRVNARVRDLRWAVADVAGWANDLASQAGDTAAGQDNLVAVIAREDSCPVGVAREQAAGMVERRRADFRSTAAALRSVPLSPGRREELIRYVDLVETFMAATLHWLASTGRFTPAPEPATVPHL